MGELIQWLWGCVCWVAGLLAVPFCYLLGALTIAGVIMFVVCAEAEVNKERTEQTADRQ